MRVCCRFNGSLSATHFPPPLSRPAGRTRGAVCVLARKWANYSEVSRWFGRGLVLLFVALYAAGAAWAVPAFEEVRGEFRSSDTVVLDRDGAVLQRVRTDMTVRRGQWVGLEDVSPALRTALLLSEDKRFYEHSGVDWRAVSATAWGNVWNSRTRGASTITMQLAGLLDEDWRAGTGGRSVVQKLGQTVTAQVLERGWRKDQILEAYLNLVPLRGELVGIDAVSRSLFGKAANGLDESEAAITAALVRSPNAKPFVVARRACEVLLQMQRGGDSRQSLATTSAGKATGAALTGAAKPADTCDGLDMLTSAALQRRSFDASEGIAPHLARLVVSGRTEPAAAQRSAASPNPPIKPTPGNAVQTLATTLRAPLQRYAVQTLQQHLGELRGRHVEDGAIVVLDNRSGEVLAWVGSSGALSGAAQVDGVTALRQPGSALKPFLYAQAIAQKRLTAASLLDDSAAHIATAGGLYIPQNYDHHFKGWVSVRTALGASLNVPAVRTLVMVSPEAFHTQLRALGLPLKESGDYYGYSLALGSAEVSLLSLTNAYRALGNGGRYSPVSFTAGAKAGATSVMDARAAFIVSDIMADSMARARTFGSDSLLATRFWSAVKTGTSKDMRDNWAIGFSQRYTVGVWVGNASGAPMWDVSGTTGAAPVWAAVMRYLHRSEPGRAPAPPAGVVSNQVVFDAPTGAGQALEAARSEWFLQGTEQTRVALNSNVYDALNGPSRNGKAASAAAQDRARITSPISGTIIALDPDIPPLRQRVSFVAQGRDTRWLMDGKPFAWGPQAQWLPWPGRHLVQLADSRGVVLDQVRIEVRGAAVSRR